MPEKPPERPDEEAWGSLQLPDTYRTLNAGATIRPTPGGELDRATAQTYLAPEGLPNIPGTAHPGQDRSRSSAGSFDDHVSGSGQGGHGSQGLQGMTSPSGATGALPLEDMIAHLPEITVVRSEDEPGEFEILGRLGEGGMGVVERAQQRALQREVAIKRLGEGNQDHAAVRALLREGLITGKVEHPSVIPVHTIGLDQDLAPVLVMRKVEGVPWLDLIMDPDHPALEDVWEDILGYHLRVLIRVCQAVELAHARGIVHRDIKPENVMIGSYGEVYLIDWGIAVAYEGYVNRGVAGTPAYMAPEMLTEGSPITPQTDVYLLGAVLHEVITGEPRHQGASFYDTAASILESAEVRFPMNVPKELEALANRAMAADPKKRHGSVAELRSALQAFLVHRSSLELTEAAQGAQEELEELLGESLRDNERGRVRARGLFTEARFAYRQALRTWSENREAQLGLRRLLLRMFEHEIACENADAAGEILVDLDEPPAELRGQLAALRERLGAEASRIRDLEAFAEANDPSRFAVPRAVLFVVLILLVVSLSLYQIFTQEGEAALSLASLTHAKLIGGDVALTLVAWIAVGATWRRLRGRISQKVLLMVAGLVTINLCVRGILWHFDAAPRAGIAVTTLIAAFFAIILSVMVHKSFARTALPLFAVALVARLEIPVDAPLTSILAVLTAAWLAVVSFRLQPVPGQKGGGPGSGSAGSGSVASGGPPGP